MAQIKQRKGAKSVVNLENLSDLCKLLDLPAIPNDFPFLYDVQEIRKISMHIQQDIHIFGRCQETNHVYQILGGLRRFRNKDPVRLLVNKQYEPRSKIEDFQLITNSSIIPTIFRCTDRHPKCNYSTRKINDLHRHMKTCIQSNTQTISTVGKVNYNLLKVYITMLFH